MNAAKAVKRQIADENFDYTGKEELQQQQAMPGYNAHIAGLFLEKIDRGTYAMDFGAGIGTISDAVKEKRPTVRILCAELDKANRAVLEQKGYEIIDDAAKCADSSLDMIFSSNVLEHIEDDEEMLKILRKKLKPGGKIAFWVPAFNCLWTSMDDKVEHYRRYTRKSMMRVFKDAGFHVEKCFYQDSVGFFVTLLFKLIGSKDGSVNTKSLEVYDRFIFPVSKIMDYLFSRIFGKNVFIYARRG